MNDPNIYDSMGNPIGYYDANGNPVYDNAGNNGSGSSGNGTGTNAVGSLTSLLTAGSGVASGILGALNGGNVANANARAAQANATASSNTTKMLLIGGAIIGAIVLIMVLRRK